VGIKKVLVNRAIASKMGKLKKGEVTSWIYDLLVFNKMKAAFGGRCRFLLTGAAPIRADVANFMAIAACAPMIEGYG